MSDIYNEILGAQDITQQICRVAYTINNTQPVVCTIIGEQPLFYMDFNDQYEDHCDEEGYLFDDVDYGILDHELKTLKYAIDKFETFSENVAQSTEERMCEFLDNAVVITGEREKQNIALSIPDLRTILKKSRLATAYIECADQYNVSLVMSAQIETAVYDRSAGQILINPDINKIDQIFLAVQELRRHWQHRQGALIHPLTFHPDNAVLVHRAQMADLIVSIVRIAWELQLADEKQIWNRIENSSMADLGRAFAREAFLDFRTINNGQAMAAVFEAWFLSERCRQQDKTLINQMLADHKGYVFELEQSEQAMTPSLICALGEMPFGKNYLAEHAMTIMDDAIFTDVRDRSNANFLWFIKFERSFRETEQELQISADPTAEGVRPSVNQETKQDQFDEHIQPQSAQIISLFAETAEDGAAKNGDKKEQSGKRLSPNVDSERIQSRDAQSGDGSNVVYLRRWSGE